MMAGNPNWWSMINHMRLPPSDPSSSTSLSSTPLSPHDDDTYVSPASSLPLNSFADHNNHFPQSWSQLLMSGMPNTEEDRVGPPNSKLENWELDQILNSSVLDHDVKQEVSQNSQFYRQEDSDGIIQPCPSSWSQVMASSPKSCLTTLSSNNVLDFHGSKGYERTKHQQDHSLECNSTCNGGVPKKARLQSSPTQPPLKVRKEKLADRITALHQIVSPFGKTDTASVLFEAIGCIRFHQAQIEALSSPYLGTGSRNMKHQHSVYSSPYLGIGSGNMRHQHSGMEDGGKDLRSRGLCLVPVSCTHLHVGDDNNNASDYWPPSLGGRFLS